MIGRPGISDNYLNVFKYGQTEYLQYAFRRKEKTRRNSNLYELCSSTISFNLIRSFCQHPFLPERSFVVDQIFLIRWQSTIYTTELDFNVSVELNVSLIMFLLIYDSPKRRKIRRIFAERYLFSEDEDKRSTAKRGWKYSGYWVGSISAALIGAFGMYLS